MKKISVIHANAVGGGYYWVESCSIVKLRAIFTGYCRSFYWVFFIVEYRVRRGCKMVIAKGKTSYIIALLLLFGRL